MDLKNNSTYLKKFGFVVTRNCPCQRNVDIKFEKRTKEQEESWLKIQIFNPDMKKGRESILLNYNCKEHKNDSN
jgi:hypothetical protein